jgi:hypothetical protein
MKPGIGAWISVGIGAWISVGIGAWISVGIGAWISVQAHMPGATYARQRYQTGMRTCECTCRVQRLHVVVLPEIRLFVVNTRHIN